MPSDPSPESFRGDFGALAEVIKESWGQNRDQSPLWDEAFLRSAFAYPGSSFDLAPTIYIDDRPAAFVAAFPRRVRFEQTERRWACITFWTTSAKFRRMGYGSVVWMEALRRIKECGFDAAVNYCVDGAPSNDIVETCGRKMGAGVHRVFSAPYIARLLQPAAERKQTGDVDVVPLFLQVAAQLSKTLPLKRAWSPKEAEWQCLRRANAMYAAHREGSRAGVITGYVAEIADETPAQVLLLEDLLWGDLERPQRLALVQDLLEQGAAAGARIAVAPLLGYAEAATLRAAGFRKSRRLMHMYVTLWDREQRFKPLSGMYLDVY
jgi:Acetyltransferase (GNAT) family